MGFPFCCKQFAYSILTTNYGTLELVLSLNMTNLAINFVLKHAKFSNVALNKGNFHFFKLPME